MSHGVDVELYVKDPRLLVALCRDVVERLDAGSASGDAAAMEAQLREIARAIEKLEKQGVPVPDALRAEKTRLAAALGVSSETSQSLSYLAVELEKLHKDIKGRIARSPQPASANKPRLKRSKMSKTDSSVLRKLIIEALQHYGGAASKKNVLNYMEDKLRDKLLPGDLERRDKTNDNVWQNNACWERNVMKNEGILKSDSPRGLWELSDVYIPK